jgi:thiamine-phosphate pyrophosphorylase
MQFVSDDSQRRSALVEQAARWAAEGIDFIQLREKDLGPLELGGLAEQMLDAITNASPFGGVPVTRLLVNGSLRAAIESHAHGVHLPSNSSLLPQEVRRRFAVYSLPRPMVTVSCHSFAEIQIAKRNEADGILFAPIFGKSIAGEEVMPGVGLEVLSMACDAAKPIPVFAMGGVTMENAPQCMEAGAAGIAGIRLFHSQPR